MKSRPTWWRVLMLAFTLTAALALAACGGDDDESTPPAGEDAPAAEATEGSEDVSGKVTVMAVWSGPEQKAFNAVLDGFKEKYPNVTPRYNSAGDQLPTVLATSVEGGNPPDIAAVAQPGLAQDLANKDALTSIDFAREDLEANFGEDWIKLGTFDGELYGMVFKGANKSTVFYNVQAFEDAGIEPPANWDELADAAATLKESGVPAYSIGGADGWTLTDLFENLYLRIAGPEKYDQLSTHEIPWTDESVTQTLEEMAKVFSDSDNIAGGTRGALQTDFPTSVSQVFSDPPEAAMIMEGDFVAGEILANTDAKAGEGFDVFPFPAAGDSGENVVVGGGDMIIAFNDEPATQALVKYLASAEAAQIWAEKGGFASPNQNLDPSVYPDDITRTTASALAEAETFRFDMSDLAPADFGGTPGQGEWKILQDFLRNPDDVQGTAQALESAAKKAFK